MSKFSVTATVTVDAQDETEAVRTVREAISQGVEYGHILAGTVGEATLVEEEITITASELDARIQAAVKAALGQ